jgi:hypothetical protein
MQRNEKLIPLHFRVKVHLTSSAELTTSTTIEIKMENYEKLKRVL